MVAGMNWLVDGGDHLVVLFYFSEVTVGERPRELFLGFQYWRTEKLPASKNCLLKKKRYRKEDRRNTIQCHSQNENN
jgi:hypothetical protein